jgi:hypothetical protein
MAASSRKSGTFAVQELNLDVVEVGYGFIRKYYTNFICIMNAKNLGITADHEERVIEAFENHWKENLKSCCQKNNVNITWDELLTYFHNKKFDDRTINYGTYRAEYKVQTKAVMEKCIAQLLLSKKNNRSNSHATIAAALPAAAHQATTESEMKEVAAKQPLNFDTDDTMTQLDSISEDLKKLADMGYFALATSPLPDPDQLSWEMQSDGTNSPSNT